MLLSSFHVLAVAWEEGAEVNPDHHVSFVVGRKFEGTN